METRELSKEEKNAIECEKFKNKVNRLTEFVHYKRMFSRMEYQKRKRIEEAKTKKSAAVKN
jgi:hypothetical protein